MGRKPAAPTPKSRWTTTSILFHPASDYARKASAVSAIGAGFWSPAAEYQGSDRVGFEDLPPRGHLLTSIDQQSNPSKVVVSCS
jgi:hypothetical protein